MAKNNLWNFSRENRSLSHTVPELTIIFRFGFRHFCHSERKMASFSSLFACSLGRYAECCFGVSCVLLFRLRVWDFEWACIWAQCNLNGPVFGPSATWMGLIELSWCLICSWTFTFNERESSLHDIEIGLNYIL